MSNKQVGISIDGEVIESRPNAFFIVKLVNGYEVLARISGKLEKNRIKIVVGDKVIVEVSPYDLKRGRIVYRYKT